MPAATKRKSKKPKLTGVELVYDDRAMRRRDEARLRVLERIDETPDAPFEGRGIHCRTGRVLAYGVGVEVVKHSTCGLSGCPCPCHRGGKP